MPLDMKRPAVPSRENEPNAKSKKLTQLFGLSDSENDDIAEEEAEQQPGDFNIQPTLVIPRTQQWPDYGVEQELAVTPIPTSSAGIGRVCDASQSQSRRMTETNNSGFTEIPATPTQDQSMATVSSGYCPDSAEQFTDAATLMLLSYLTGDGPKRDHTQVDTNAGQRGMEASTSKRLRIETMPVEEEVN